MRKRSDLADWLDENPANEVARSYAKFEEKQDETGEEDKQRTVDGATFILSAPEKIPGGVGRDDEVLWPEGESLMIAGGLGLGKTTLAGLLVRALLFGGEVLGLPVLAADAPILYLAMDRPRQIGRSVRRQFTEQHQARLKDRLIVWPGPLEQDLAKTGSTDVSVGRILALSSSHRGAYRCRTPPSSGCATATSPGYAAAGIGGLIEPGRAGDDAQGPPLSKAGCAAPLRHEHTIVTNLVPGRPAVLDWAPMSLPVSEDDDFPPDLELYHYTTANGLHEILNKNVLWATHVAYLNDSQEFTYGMQVIVDELSAFARNPPAEAMEGWDPRLSFRALVIPVAVWLSSPLLRKRKYSSGPNFCARTSAHSSPACQRNGTN